MNASGLLTCIEAAPGRPLFASAALAQSSIDCTREAKQGMAPDRLTHINASARVRASAAGTVESVLMGADGFTTAQLCDTGKQCLAGVV